MQLYEFAFGCMKILTNRKLPIWSSLLKMAVLCVDQYCVNIRLVILLVVWLYGKTFNCQQLELELYLVEILSFVNFHLR